MVAIQCPYKGKCVLLGRQKLSEQFKQAILSKEKPCYQIAAEARIAPAILSEAINDKKVFDLDDERIKRVAQVIGFKGQIFEPAVNE